MQSTRILLTCSLLVALTATATAQGPGDLGMSVNAGGPGVKVVSPPDSGDFSGYFRGGTGLAVDDVVYQVNGVDVDTISQLTRQLRRTLPTIHVLYRDQSTGKLVREGWRRTGGPAGPDREYSVLLGLLTEKVMGGLRVVSVRTGSFAAADGITTGIVLTEANSTPLNRLNDIVSKTALGDVQLKVQSGGTRRLLGPIISVGGGTNSYLVELKTRGLARGPDFPAGFPVPSGDRADTADDIEVRIIGSGAPMPAFRCSQTAGLRRFQIGQLNHFRFVNAPNVGTIQQIQFSLVRTSRSRTNDLCWCPEFIRVQRIGSVPVTFPFPAPPREEWFLRYDVARARRTGAIVALPRYSWTRNKP